MQLEVRSSCLRKITSRSHHKPTEPSSNLSHWHIFSYYSTKFTSRIAQSLVAKLQTTGLRNRISIPEKSMRLFSPPKPHQPLNRSPHSPLQCVKKAPFLRIKHRMEIQKQKVLNETCHGEYRWTNLMSLVLLFHYLLLNMFRMLVHPSSGACELLWIYFMCCSSASACIRIPHHPSRTTL